MNTSVHQKARNLLRAERSGLLSTLSQKLGGYPFGTAVSYLTDQEARPIFLISQLAEHTRNIDHDPRVSLLVHEQTSDVQAGERLTVVGDAARIKTTEELKARYLRYYPQARQYFELDFFFYRIEPRHMRYIGGFGEARWLSPGDLRPPANTVAEEEESILAHMNRDHPDSLQNYCRFYYGKEAGDNAMVGIDCDGFDILADGELLRFDFAEPVLDGQQAAEALVAMAREAEA